MAANTGGRGIGREVFIGVAIIVIGAIFTGIMTHFHFLFVGDSTSTSAGSSTNAGGVTTREYFLTDVAPDNGQTNRHVGFKSVQAITADGKVMSHSIVYDCQEACGAEPDVATYLIGGDFHWLTVTIAPENTATDRSGQGTTSILGDGAVLHTVTVTAESTARRVRVDVSGVETVTISASAVTAVNADGSGGSNGPVIVYGTPTLTK